MPLKNKNPDNFKLTCHLCGRNFNLERSYRYHFKSVHGSEFEMDCVKNFKKCPLCDFKNLRRSQLISHFVSEHSVSIQNEEMVFASLEEVMEWKEAIEHDTNTRFVKDNQQTFIDFTVMGYKCHRSGNYKSRGHGKRRLKQQGSNKINAFCPASIQVTVGQVCKVKFQSTHVGHVNDTSHLTLSTQEKSILIEKLSSEMTFHTIIDEIKKSAPTDEKLRRIHKISRKDLHNIKQRISLKQEFQQKDKGVCMENIQESATVNYDTQRLGEPRTSDHTKQVFPGR